MTRPWKASTPRDGIWALSRVGVTMSRREQAMAQICLDAEDILGAQRIILKSLSREIDGPPIRVAMRHGRKRIVYVSRET